MTSAALRKDGFDGESRQEIIIYVRGNVCLTLTVNTLLSTILYVPGIVLKAGDAKDKGTALSCPMELIDG